jgi:hypothetical protein
VDAAATPIAADLTVICFLGMTLGDRRPTGLVSVPRFQQGALCRADLETAVLATAAEDPEDSRLGPHALAVPNGSRSTESGAKALSGREREADPESGRPDTEDRDRDAGPSDGPASKLLVDTHSPQ